MKGGDPVPSLADLLNPGDRERLTALAGQPAGPDLAGAARDAARESHGDGRTAWLLVAVALTAAPTPDQARAALDQALDDTPLRNIALACLSTLLDTGPQQDPAATALPPRPVTGDPTRRNP